MDEGAFEKLYSRLKNRVYNTVLSYLQNREDAEEITQDVFIEAYRSFSTFKGEASADTWIYRIAVNKALDHLRYKNRKKRFAFMSSLFKQDSGELKYEPPGFDHPGLTLENK